MKKLILLINLSGILFICFVMNNTAKSADLTIIIPATSEARDSVFSNSSIYLSVSDLRSEPAIAGYKCNQYESRFKAVKFEDPDISKVLAKRYIDELTKYGFNFTSDENNCDLKLKLVISSFLAESIPGAVWKTKGICSAKVSLSTCTEQSDIFSSDLHGKSEIKSGLWKEALIHEAVWSASDDLLNKILKETTLIQSVNEYAR